MIYFCVDGKQNQILEVFGAEADPRLQLLLPCAPWCIATVMMFESLDLLELNDSDEGDCTERIYSHIGAALSTALQDFSGAPDNLWP